MSTNFHSSNFPLQPWSDPTPLCRPRPDVQIVSVEPERTSTVTEVVGSLPDDEKLIAFARNGDINAFDKLIWRLRGNCMKRALRILGDRSAAEDAVQSACKKAFQCVNQFQATGSFVAWLNRIVENECLMQIRQARNARFVYLDNTTASGDRLELVNVTTSPEDELGWKQVKAVLRKEISLLPPLFRNIILLHYGKQLPIRDVAERLGVSVPAAKSRLSRARTELRARIRKHCGRKGQGTLVTQTQHNRSAFAHAS